MCSIRSGRIACIEPIGSARFCKTPGQGFAREVHPRGADHRMLHNARFLPTDGEIYCRARDLCRRRKDAGGRGRDEPVRRRGQDEAVERGAGMGPAEGGPVVRIGRRERDGPVGRRGQDGRVRKCGRDGHVDKPDTAAGAGKPGAARARKKPGAFPLPALNAKWWAMQGSNLRPTACKAAALPLRQSPKRWSILPYPARLRKPLVVHDDGVTDLDDVVESRRLRRRQVAAPV